MKNLKYVYKCLLVLPLVFMVGCVGTDDYEDVLSNQYTQRNTVFIETDDSSEIIRSVPGGTAIPLEVGINNAPSSDVTVSFSVTKDGAAAEAGVDYEVADATIFASNVTGSTDIFFLLPGSFEITVNSASDGSLIAVDNRLIFNVPPAVTISISWGDDFYDYDLFLVTGNQDFSGDVLGSSTGISAFETFDAYPPEGISSVFINDFYNDNASTDVILIIEVDGVAETYDVVMDMDKWVLTIETTIDDEGTPSYEFTPL
jgi:hypothetical protein